ncbi:glycosyltransferase family 2 protein [Halocatena pleomorpha]|uniref:Glycosyltransferase family 2 protein n=1 Tax=Halocatena pleomorpha TaxID=1785090 RepID=A0A3P3RER3_9EURY|nr:glycosyltransferase family 2 protein [Halocatena pleomorpha]RRJ31824.1 glycosyltransferase family 2 protein [Halocatena pleomorpha]
MTEGTDNTACGTSSDKRTGVIETTIEDGVAGPPGNITTNRNAGHEHIPRQQFELEISESICSVLVAIPAYNEAATIGDVVQTASEYADYVLVIDDGSEDDTAVRATAVGGAVIKHRQNRGYGAALKTAFEVASRYNAHHLVVLDGDGQHDAADVPRLVAAQERTGAHLVIGSRFIEGATSNAPLYRWIGLKTINGLTNLSLGVVRAASRVSDTQSGFRAYDQTAIETLAADRSIGNWMDASTDILYHAHHHSYSIEEVPITVTYDVANASTRAPLSHGVVLMRNILKTIERERPLTALAVPGFGLTFGGMGVGYMSLDNYIQSGTFPVGLALTAAVLMLIGTFACFTAIVLHALSTYFANTGMGDRRIR